MKRLRRGLPFIVSAVLVTVLISYAPWSKVAGILADLDAGPILVLLGLSLGYYALKTIRFWYLLQAMEIVQPLWPVALSYMSAQPVTLLPAGELYRSRSLERHTGVPIKASLPQFTMQGVLEGIAMATLSIISALALGTLRIPVLAISAIILLCIIGISRGYISGFTRLLNHLPFIHISGQTIDQFSERHQNVLSKQWLPLLYGLSLAIEIIGAAIAYAAVLSIGIHISIYLAVLTYAIPIVLGFFSLLPGGFGVSEQSAVGILLLSHVNIGQAVAAMLVMRVTIVGTGLVYGGIAYLIGEMRLRQLPAKKPGWQDAN